MINEWFLIHTREWEVRISLGLEQVLSASIQYNQFNNFTSVLLSYKSIIYKSPSLWSSINFRAIYGTTFIKPSIFYQFQSNTWHNIHQASDILSISEHYPDQYSTSLCSYINFRVIDGTTFITPPIFYQFQSIIQTRIHQASDLLSILDHYPSQY